MNNKPLLLDTHAWLWLANGDSTLRKTHRELINQASLDGTLYISAISSWEICMLEKKERIILSCPSLEWINHSITLANMQIIPISPEVAAESCHLPGRLHEDPADRLIVASARVHGLTLLTRDQKILNYSKKDYLKAIKI